MDDHDDPDDLGIPQLDVDDDVTAVILAGGAGLRMRPHTGPKCLIELRGQPMIYSLLDHLMAGGVRKFVVCVGYQADQVRFTVGQYPAFTKREAEIQFSDAGEHATMGQRLSEATKLVGTPKTLVCYGDTLGDVDIRSVWSQCQDTDAAMVVSSVPLKTNFGILRPGPEDPNRLARIDEKPELPYLINIGFIMAQSFVFLRLEPADDIPKWINRIAVEDRVEVYRHLGWHVTVNTEHDLEEAREFFSRR